MPVDARRKAAQEKYIIDLAAKKGITVGQLESRLLRDLNAGVPADMLAILTNMFHAAERVTAVDYDPFAPDYDALAEQEPTSQYQDSRESAGMA